MRRLAAVAVLPLAFLASIGCRRGVEVTIAFTHGSGGHMDPSGPAGGVGGFARRAAVLDELKRTERSLIVVDGGDVAPWGTDALHAEYAYDAAQRVGYEAVVPGERDLFWNLGRGLAREVPELPWVCANVARAGEGRVGRAWGIREIAGRRIALVGLCGSDTAAHLAGEARARFLVLDPEKAFRAAHEKLRRDVLCFVVLAHQPLSEALALSARLPGHGVWVAGHGDGDGLPPRRSGGWIVVHAGAAGENVGVVRVRAGEGETNLLSSRVLALDADRTDAPRIAEVAAKLRRLDLDRWEGSLFLSHEPQPAARAESCGTCHAKQHAQWKSTAHARAGASRARRGASDDASCLRCHATGTGFDSLDLPDVSCLACHAVSLEPESHGVLESRVSEAGKDLCLRCHTAEMSPAFDYPRALARIRH